MSTILRYPFTEEEFRLANAAWGCNCGPSALAFVLQKPLEVARDAIPSFMERGYTSPTMMRLALERLGLPPHMAVIRPPIDRQSLPALLFHARPALVRIQFTGPWMGPRAHPKAAYAHTHWIVAWEETATPGSIRDLRVFDCNGGILSFDDWQSSVLPHLIPQRGDGGWYPTHIWRTA